MKIEDLEQRLSFPADSVFNTWRDSVPDKHWAKRDLSAVRIGYELGKSYQPWQQRCLDIGFEYWRAPDAHGVECTHEQALALLRDLLGVEVDFKASIKPDKMEVCFGCLSPIPGIHYDEKCVVLPEVRGEDATWKDVRDMYDGKSVVLPVGTQTEDELITRIAHVVKGIREGAYVGRQTMQQLIVDIHAFGESLVDPWVTQEMVREAEAHFPFDITEKPARWQWFADFYNHAINNPNDPCKCCNVTPAGDICEQPELPL